MEKEKKIENNKTTGIDAKLTEDIESISSGENWPDEDIADTDHPYHVVYDHNGNKTYDGHALLLQDLLKKKTG